MQSYQVEFLEFAIKVGVLRFGEFTLKSGRVSPYFFNSGLFNSGASIAALGRFYAASIEHDGIEYDMVYGPAYKGIPLATAVAIALSEVYDKDVPYAFNRKEIKDHGEGGIIVGAELQGRVLIIDDVISAGTSVRESVDIIKLHNAQAAGVSISLDRQEKGQGDNSAIEELRQQFGLQIASIVTLENLIDYLKTNTQYQSHLDAILKYQAKYGTKSE